MSPEAEIKDFIDEATAEHVELTLTSSVEIQSNLGIDSNAKVIVHGDIPTQGPFQRNSGGSPCDFKDPSIEFRNLGALNLPQEVNGINGVGGFSSPIENAW